MQKVSFFWAYSGHFWTILAMARRRGVAKEKHLVLCVFDAVKHFCRLQREQMRKEKEKEKKNSFFLDFLFAKESNIDENEENILLFCGGSHVDGIIERLTGGIGMEDVFKSVGESNVSMKNELSPEGILKMMSGKEGEIEWNEKEQLFVDEFIGEFGDRLLRGCLKDDEMMCLF